MKPSTSQEKKGPQSHPAFSWRTICVIVFRKLRSLWSRYSIAELSFLCKISGSPTSQGKLKTSDFAPDAGACEEPGGWKKTKKNNSRRFKFMKNLPRLGLFATKWSKDANKDAEALDAASEFTSGGEDCDLRGFTAGFSIRTSLRNIDFARLALREVLCL